MLKAICQVSYALYSQVGIPSCCFSFKNRPLPKQKSQKLKSELTVVSFGLLFSGGVDTFGALLVLQSD